MSRARKFALVLAGFATLVVGGSLWIAGTESGTRWILGRATTFLPQELAIGGARGSFLGGLKLEFVEWRSEPVLISTRDVYLDIKLLPLFFRHVAVNELNVARFAIDISDTGRADDDTGLPTVDLPIGISITNANLESVSIRSGSFARTTDDVSLAGNLFGSNLNISRLRIGDPELQIDLDGRVTLSGAWPGRVRVAWQWGEPAGRELAGLLRLQGDTRRYELQHSLTAPVMLSTSGSLSLESGIWIADLTNEWESLEMPFGERRLRSPSGSLRLNGSVNNYDVTLDTQVRLDDAPVTRIQLNGNADLEAIRISNLRAVNQLGDLTGTGSASWSPELTFDIEYSLSGVDPSIASDAITGNLEFDGRVTGRYGEYAPEFDLHIDRLGGDINGHVLRGSADVAYAADTWSLTDASIQAGSNRVDVSGTLGETVSMSADIELSAIAELLPEAAGELRGRLAVSGTRDRPDTRIELTGTALEYADYSLAAFSADASLQHAEQSSAEFQFEKVSAGRLSFDSARISLTGRISEHDLRVTLNGYRSELVTEADGRFSNGRWSGRIDSLLVSNDAVGNWSSRQPGRVIVSTDEVSLSETCVSATAAPGRACVAAVFHRDESASVDASVDDLPLSAIPVTLPAAANLSGAVDARLQMEIRNRRLTGDAGITLRQATVDAIYDEEPLSVAFSEAAASATITDNRIDSTLRLEMADGDGTGELRLSVEDFADRQSAIDGYGSVSIGDASLFAVFMPAVSNPRGKIEGGLTISGTLADPQFLGEIALTGGAFGVRQAGIEIVDVDATLSQDATGHLRLTGSARSGGGEVSIRGDTRVGTDSGIRTEIVLSGENFELLRLPDWQVAASPSITVVFDERMTALTGNLGIPVANITVKYIPETAESPSPDAIVHRGEDTQTFTARRFTMDIVTMLGSDVRFSGFGLTAGLEGAVRLQGGTREPYLGTGTVVLRDGRYKAYGQELEIERGELLFNGPLDEPQLDIRAIRRANDVTAGIHLTGTPSQLRSEVFSEPVLSDAEALSYLLTGRPLASSSGAAEGDVLNNAAFALGLSGAGRIASQVQSELGLETLAVEGGSDSGRIVAGKRINSRLLVEYGYGLIDKLGTLLLRYQLTDRIVLESRTGTVSVLDIVYSVKKQ